MNINFITRPVTCILPVLILLVSCCFLISPDLCHAMGRHKVPGSVPGQVPDAVNLLVKKHYTVNKDGSYTLELYFKTRLNTYKGKKDRGDFRFGYNSSFEKVEVKLARTILPDGRIIDVSPKEINDIADPSTQAASIFSGARLRVINFPSVQKGCVIELRMVKKSAIGFWGLESFRLNDPCREKQVIIDMPEGSYLAFQIGSRRIRFSERHESGRRVLEWTGKQLEKAPDDPMRPPVENMDSTLVFSSFRSWQGVGGWFKKFLPGPDAEEGHGWFASVKPSDNANSIFCWLSKRLHVLPLGFFNTRLHFQLPVQTLESGYGTQLDAALLFYHILKARGMSPELLAASSRRVWMKGIRNTFYPGALDTFLVRHENRYYLFGSRNIAPGITGLDGQMALSLDTGRFEAVRDARPTSSTITYHITPESPASIKYSYKGHHEGIQALGMRTMFKDLTKGELRVRTSIFYHSLSSLAVPDGDLKISDLDPASGPVDIEAAYHLDGFPVVTPSFYVLPIPRISLLDAMAVNPPDRKADLFLGSQKSARLTVEIMIPMSFRLKHLPGHLQGVSGPVSWKNACQVIGHKIRCVRQVSIKRGFVSRGEMFQSLRNQVLELMDPEQNCIYLEPAD